MDAVRRRAIHDAMVRLSDGDRSAFDVLLDALWPVLKSFVERGVGRGADAEDVAQEVFSKVCSGIADFDRSRDGLSWAFGIASFEVMTHHKRRQRRREVNDEGWLVAQADRAASQEESLLARETAQAFELAMGTLTDEDREALGLTSHEPGVKSAAERKRKQRALERLRGFWRSIYGDP